MAVAFTTPGSPHRGCPRLVQEIRVVGLQWMLANRYSPGQAVYGNWWPWEIGAPLALTDTMLLTFG
jgi:hyaluronate lyase